MTRPRLFATDLDGTFLDGPAHVHPLNAGAVRVAAHEGVPTMFCTGRPLRWLGFLRDVGAHTHAVTSNGAMIVDLRRERVERRWPLPDGALREVVADIQAALPDATFALEWGDEFGTEVVLRESERQHFFVAPVARLLDHRPDPVKLLVRHRGIPSNVLAPQIAALAGDRLSCTFSWVSRDGLAELAAPGVSKAAALEVWARDAGIDATDVVAFGDMPNDLPLLRWAGRGYVVATAHPSLRTGEFTVIPGPQPTAVGRTIRTLLKA